MLFVKVSYFYRKINSVRQKNKQEKIFGRQNKQKDTVEEEKGTQIQSTK